MRAFIMNITYPHVIDVRHASPTPKRFHLRLPRMTTLLFGGVLLISATLAAIFAEQITPYDPTQMMPLERLHPPSLAHPFGTDLMGRDLLSRVVFGAQISLMVAAIATLISALPGIILGMIGGMYRSGFTLIIDYLMDAWMAIPGLLIVIALTAAFERNPVILAISLGIAGIPAVYRLMRNETLKQTSALYIQAARASGAPESYILLRHILPNTLPIMIIFATLRMGGLLIAISTFSFIGLGAQPPTPEWGTLLAESRDYFHQAWWLMVFPGLAISLTVLGLNLLADGLRDWLLPE
ncbi:MAG: peptide ABC transporter permease [Phototrophicales bacterium]|nr:MAG: peptide ABC transporter permease [Phototrophicales bacterium]